MFFIARVASSAIAALSLAGLISLSAAGHAETVQPTSPVIQMVKSLTAPEVPVDVARPAPTAGMPIVQPAAAPAASITAVAAQDDEADEEFASLDAAVAAQDQVAADEATRCLAGAVYFESQGEPLRGQLAVAQVILNRAKSGRFPSDVCDVVTQRGQFSFVRGGRIPSIDQARAAYRTAVAVARVAINDVWDGAAEHALYFNASRRAPGARLQRVAAIGNHVFWR